ncbi:DUF732 domain-containing protein [Kineococcus sp. SYSU DK003]|uniref:DUF732 domain-containing protein n=1 Tax=Kineococcus sp. SYSU DK003 TaxID=3383124 RepID=UPI003D7E46DF
MLTRRLAPLVLLGAAVLAGCSGQDEAAPAVTVTVTETPSASASTPTGDEAAFVRDVLDDSPALDRIVEGDLVKIGRMACDTLTSGGSEEIAEQGLLDGSTQFTPDEAGDIVDAARDHLC